jgi:hypothetical protein
MAGFVGVTAIKASVGGACTVRVVCPDTPANAAEMVVPPAETPVAEPLAPIVATRVLDDVHATWLVMFFVLLSE